MYKIFVFRKGRVKANYDNVRICVAIASQAGDWKEENKNQSIVKKWEWKEAYMLFTMQWSKRVSFTIIYDAMKQKSNRVSFTIIYDAMKQKI